MNNPQACRAQNCWNTASMWWSSSAVNRRFSRVTMYCWIIWWCWQIKNKNKTQTFIVFIYLYVRTGREAKACKNHRSNVFKIVKHIFFPQHTSHWQEQHNADPLLIPRKKACAVLRSTVLPVALHSWTLNCVQDTMQLQRYPRRIIIFAFLWSHIY